MTASRYERSRKPKRQSRKVEDSKEVIRRRKSRRTDNAMTKTTGKKQKWSEKYYTENLDLET